MLACTESHSWVEDERNPIGELARLLEALKLPCGNRHETVTDWLNLEVATIRKLPVFVRDFGCPDLRVGANERERVFEATSRLVSLRGIGEVDLHLRVWLFDVVVR